jgi:SOS-response transcriptional repressor LexA
MPKGKLTDLQKKYVAFISDFRNREGYSPTLGEIADNFRVKIGSVQSVLFALQKKGFVTWKKGQYRTLVVTPQPGMHNNEK